MVDIAKKLEWRRAEIHAAAGRPGSSAAMDILQIWKLFGHNDASNDKQANEKATERRPIRNQSIDEINVSNETNEGGATGIGLILNKRESEDGYDTYVCEVLSGGSALLSGKVLVI